MQSGQKFVTFMVRRSSVELLEKGKIQETTRKRDDKKD